MTTEEETEDGNETKPQVVKTISSKELLPDTFKIGDDFSIWRKVFKACAKANKWTYDEACVRLTILFKGQAFRLFDQLNTEDFTSIEEILDALRDKVNPPAQQSARQQEFYGRQRKSAESITKYASDLVQLAEMVFPGKLADSTVQTVIMQRFFDGLRPNRVRELTCIMEMKNLDEAVAAALKVETTISTGRGDSEEDGMVVTNMMKNDHKDEWKEHMSKQMEVLTASLNNLQGNYGRGRGWNRGGWNRGREGWNRGRGGGSSYGKSKCYRCQEEGHFAKDCPAPAPVKRPDDRPGN